MSRPDATASAALDAAYIQPGFFAFLDILGDPIRVTTIGYNAVVSAPEFPEMDGQAFIGIDGRLTDIGEVAMKQGGSDRVIARLSGIRAIDNDTLNTVGDPANWRGRTAMLWRLIRDETGTVQGGIQHYYTGYMMSLGIGGSPDEQTIDVTIESYLAAFSEPSNRSYLDQEKYDPGDLSARAAIAIANGTSGNPLVNNTAVGSRSGAGAAYGVGSSRGSLR